jgi:hypothetical protein
MRRVLIVLMVVALLAVSIGIGVVVARWPHLQFVAQGWRV